MALSFNRVSIFCAFLVLGACTKTLDFPLPEEKPKIVLDAKLIVGDSIKVLAGISAPFWSNATPVLSDSARIYLFENQLLIDTLQPKAVESGGLFDSTYFLYTSGKPLNDRALYTIKASVEGFPDVEGSDRVPGKPEPLHLVIDTVEKQISFSLINQSVPAYYLFDCYLDRENERLFLNLSTSDPEMLVQESSGYIYTGASLPEGIRYYLKNENSGQRAFNFRYSAQFDLSGEIVFRILQVSSDYYRHEVSKGTQEADVPLFSDQGNLHSNVKNGYGIVACAHKTEIRVNR